MTDLAGELATIVGADHVLVDRDVTASYATDWTGRFAGDVSLVVRPGDAAETAAVRGDVRRRRRRPRAAGRQHRSRRRQRAP